MVQIYNKNRVIQDRYCQVLKTKKVRNSLSFTPFPMDVYRYLSILTLRNENRIVESSQCSGSLNASFVWLTGECVGGFFF